MTVISSWGGATSNSYISLTNAHSLATTTLIDYANWTNATTAQREAALITASRDIDAGQWYGARYYHDQKLEFPRRGRLDYPFNDQVVLETTTSVFQSRMQQDVELATVLQANFRLGGTLEASLLQQSLGVSEQTDQVGPLTKKVKFGGGGGPGGSAGKVLHPESLNILSKYRVGRRVWRA